MNAARSTMLVLMMALASGSASGDAPRSERRPSSSSAPTVTLDAPRHLVVLHYQPRVVIGWTYDGQLTTGFEVERANGAESPLRFHRVATPGRDARSFRDPTSHAGPTYVYRVRAVGAGTISPYSKELIVWMTSRRGG